MIQLNSSCLSGVDYDPVSRTLFLRFRNGHSYTLPNVPEHHYLGLVNSSSPGWYFNTYLKGRY